MSIYNADELKEPSWMVGSFFETVLSQYEKDDDIKIVKYDISPASLKGDHYASIMFRVKVEYKFLPEGAPKTISLIVKTIPEEEGTKRDFLIHSSLFKTEINMYLKTIPKVEEVLRGHGDNTRFAPKIIYSSLEPNQVIIFEDLCELGYSTVSGRFLTDDELLAVYAKISKFHAVTYMLGQTEDHEIVTGYNEGVFSNSLVTKNELMAGGIVKFIDFLSTQEEFEIYLDKIKSIEKDLFRDCMNLYRAYQNGVKDEIFVLNHGDFHIKNMMFKFFKKTQLEDFLLVDFQVCVFAPSIIDLTYSTFMLYSSEQRQRKNSFFHKYYEGFISTLKQIKFEGKWPKFGEIQMAGIRYKSFAVFLISSFLPMVANVLGAKPEDISENQEFDKLFENPDLMSLMYRNPVFIAELKILLPKMLEEGYLD